MSKVYDPSFKLVDFLIVMCVLTSFALLGFLLWSYVPNCASEFATLNVQLPLPTRLAIFASNWFVRLLPFAVVLAVSGSGVFLAIGLWLGLTKRRVLRLLLSILALAVLIASAAIVGAMHLAMRNVPAGFD